MHHQSSYVSAGNVQIGLSSEWLRWKSLQREQDKFFFKLKRARIQSHWHVLARARRPPVLTSLEQMLRDLLIVRANHHGLLLLRN